MSCPAELFLPCPRSSETLGTSQKIAAAVRGEPPVLSASLNPELGHSSSGATRLVVNVDCSGVCSTAQAQRSYESQETVGRTCNLLYHLKTMLCCWAPSNYDHNMQDLLQPLSIHQPARFPACLAATKTRLTSYAANQPPKPDCQRDARLAWPKYLSAGTKTGDQSRHGFTVGCPR
jgi:hypothetical protein